MFSLDFFKRKKSPSNKPGSGQDPPKPSFSVDKIHPQSTHLLGVIISFCIDNDSIQMAAIRHWGKSRRLIDIKKEYFPRDAGSNKAQKDVILREVSDFVSKNGGYGTT